MANEVEMDIDYTDEAVEAWADLKPEADLSPLATTMRLRRVVNGLDELLSDVIAPTPLATYGDYQVLSLLRRSRRPIQPSELAEALQVTRSGTTGRLHRLEALGLVQRRPDPEDARRANISITRKGARLADKLLAAGLDAQARALAALSKDEQRALANLLRKLSKGITDGTLRVNDGENRRG